MKVLVACEYSGRVREAMKSQGHQVVSVDLRPPLIPGIHLIADVRDVISPAFDMMIAFPPCTYLSNAGNRYKDEAWEMGYVDAALDFAEFLLDYPIPRICVENPPGLISTCIRPPTQVINPFQFGDPFKKRTCLWLKNLPPLVPDNVVNPVGHWLGKKGEVEHAVKKHRDETFPGIARAMGNQWGSLSDEIDTCVLKRF